jgi:NAD(P)-dependent dehydrogenase (short-subunit alcohol dehydrogenase family)
MNPPAVESLFSLDGRVCLVTGGSRGLGYQIARGFLDAGAARVYITARTAEACEEAVVSLSNHGKCLALPCDISLVANIGKLVAELTEREEHVDVLVNNAGTGWGAAFGEYPEKGWDKVMDLNVKSPFFLTQAMTPLLKKNATADNTASVINIGSIAAIIGDAFQNYSYGASKAAVHQMTRNLAKDLAEDHIRVNAIAPGRFFTKLTEYASQNKAQYETEIAAIPLHRWGGDTDIAGVAIMLASKAGAFITGEIIRVDGGATLVS